MELREIRTFLIVAEELHFTRAAARLHVAQSAVSHAIKKLEEELGVTLLARSQRHVALTAAGEAFRVRATDAMAAIDHAEQAARRIARGDAGRLVLRFTMATALTVVPRAIARFQRDHPAVELDLQVSSSVAQIAAIQAGQCDLGFMGMKQDLSPLATEVIERAQLMALFATGHPLARRRSLRLAELSGERFIMFELTGEVRGVVRSQCIDAGFDPRIVLESAQIEVVLAKVAAGVGVACIPSLFRQLRFPGVVSVPITPAIEGAIGAVWNPTTISPVARKLLAFVLEERSAMQSAGAAAIRRRARPAKRGPAT